jgi:hypothetical protein
MANINLAAASFENNDHESSYNKGLMVILAILVILAGAYIWIYFAAKSAVSKKNAAKVQYDAEYAKFIGGNNTNVMDFQNRITIAKDLLNQKNPGYDSLPAIEAAMVQGIYLKALDFDLSKNAIKVSGVADNFDMMAKQILSFKQSTFFSGVTTGTTNLDENGKVNFELNLIIK